MVNEVTKVGGNNSLILRHWKGKERRNNGKKNGEERGEKRRMRMRKRKRRRLRQRGQNLNMPSTFVSLSGQVQ